MPLSFEILSRVMVIVAIAMIAVPLVRGSAGGRAWLSVSVAALFIYLGSAVAYPYLSNWDWPEGGAATAAAAPGQAPGGGLAPDLNALAAAVQAAPDDPQAWARLATGLIVAKRPAEAVAPLERVLEMTGGSNPDWTLLLVDALMMTDDTARERVSMLVEQVLQRQPEHPKGLYYGAELAFSRGELALARSRWERLLERARGENTPEAANVRQVLEQRIAQVSERLGDAVPAPRAPSAVSPADVPVDTAPPAASGPALTVSVSLDPDRAAAVAPGSPVFIIARSGQGPPVAVVRRRVADLPLEVTLTDENAMMPTRRLSNFESVQIVARVSTSGGPVAASGDIYGEADVATSRLEPIDITMSTVVP